MLLRSPTWGREAWFFFLLQPAKTSFRKLSPQEPPFLEALALPAHLQLVKNANYWAPLLTSRIRNCGAGPSVTTFKTDSCSHTAGFHLQTLSQECRLRSSYLSVWGTHKYWMIETTQGTSLVAQRLGLHVPCAGVLGSSPGQGTRSCMPQVRLGAAK